MAKIAKAVITKNDRKIEVFLENWEGVSGTDLEIMYNQLVKAAHRARAAGMQKFREADRKDELSKQDVKETTNVSA